MSDRTHRLQNQLIDLQSDLDRASFASRTGTEAVLVRTALKDVYPTSAAAFYWCELLDASGTPAEGEPGVFKPRAQHLAALNLGSQVPPVGTILLAVNAGGRWTIRHDG